ncbi:hypothetical protein [Armatimonas sp.]|uniref:hypothetical protein n=1 Tax=Armatimonas sp. TaxID=1872638 RepID=UPI00374CA79D
MSGKKQPIVPTMDKRILMLYLRLLALAGELRNRASFGCVHLFTEEYIVQAHASWRLELKVPELDDYHRQPEGADYLPIPPSAEEALELLERIVTTCSGVRGLESPAVPNVADLLEAEQLLQRRPAQRR